jgi:hypothetical protein
MLCEGTLSSIVSNFVSTIPSIERSCVEPVCTYARAWRQQSEGSSMEEAKWEVLKDKPD